MTQLHFHPIAGQSLSIIDTILHTQEVVSVGGSLSPVHLIIEELVVNIVDYAYPVASEDPLSPTDDYLDVEITLDDSKLTFRFHDGGVPFNPLQQTPPDTSLPMSKRKKGGLGIFLVKKEADDISYEYTGCENVLTVSFNISNHKEAIAI